MSELKDYSILDIEAIDDERLKKSESGKIQETRVYIKFDADKVIRHQKYKRCLAMAKEWRNHAASCGMQSSCHNHRGFGKTAEKKWTWKECHAWICAKLWLTFAEKFKEAK